MIGRNRIRAACATAASFIHAFALHFVCELHNQNAISRNETDQRHQTQLASKCLTTLSNHS